MEILQSFGIETKLFVAQVINFLILAFLIRAFLYKPLRRALEERRERIRKGLSDADQAKLSLEETDRNRKAVLLAARTEAQSIIEGARGTAEEIRQKIIVDSKAESERIMEQAKALAAAEMDRMEKQVQVMSLDLSRKVLLEMMPTLFTAEEKGRILERAAGEMEKGASHGQHGNA